MFYFSLEILHVMISAASLLFSPLFSFTFFLFLYDFTPLKSGLSPFTELKSDLTEVGYLALSTSATILAEKTKLQVLLC